MEHTSQFKLIYVLRINDEAHSDCLKIGEAFCDERITLGEPPNTPALNELAEKRIRSYTKTASIQYELLHTEIAVANIGGKITSFNDKAIHDVLDNSGVKRKDFKHDNQGTEWFVTDLETVKKAIAALKEGRKSLIPGEITINRSPIVLRPEQREAIEMAKKSFKKRNKVLWNAKMRFGKTLTATQLFREMEFKNTIIVTHRPTVEKSWFEDFDKIFYDNASLKPCYNYGARDRGETLDNLKAQAAKKGTRYLYFASLQDLRGSEIVGGNFDKNNGIFDTEWDLVIIDEADEGTKTELGTNVLNALTSKNTKQLHLTGTAYNIFDDFDVEDVYSWEYTDEQAAKANWDLQHFGDHNPYHGQPRMNIRTYALGDEIKGYKDEEVDFNFREFFRVGENGEFVHQSDIKRFLNMLCRSDVKSFYPFSNQHYRDLFRHTLWIVPGVKEAKALSAMLQSHDVFGQFQICNVAGDGDEDAENENALDMVKKAIGDDPDLTQSITISCGRLTRGTSIGAWMGILMLAGSYKSAAQTYMQTIFRVQTAATINGKVKTEAYVFDFAPDRVLSVIAEVAQKSNKNNKSNDARTNIEKFINFCPIIAIQGSETKPYNADNIFNQLKKISIERIITRGFDDPKLYNDQLLQLDDLELKEFKKLKEIIGSTPALTKTKDIIINEEGFIGEGKTETQETKKTKKNKEKDKEEEKRKKQRTAAISILRGISIRMPLMIYGADLNDHNVERITIQNFTQIIDDDSWKEFMPKGVSKEEFNKFSKYYDADMFISVAERVRSQIKAADNLNIEERIDRLASLFECFRNPDKETVLTPWRVVNMHLGDTLGGYNFFDTTYTQRLDEPRLICHPNITENTFGNLTNILEINSKTGLYPLYVAYSTYRYLKTNTKRTIETAEDKLALWDQVISENIFVICKTPMAEHITRRTLLGFREKRANIKTYQNLVETIKNEPDKFLNKIIQGRNFWNANNNNNMKFNAVVGNPPYQEIIGGNENASLASQLFPDFIKISILLKPEHCSLITPCRWFTGEAQDKSFVKLRLFAKENNHFQKIVIHTNSNTVFNDTEIKGGIQYFLWKKDYIGNVFFQIIDNDKVKEERRLLFEDGLDIILTNSIDFQIIKKVQNNNFVTLMTITTGRNPFGIIGKEDFVNRISKSNPFLNSIPLRCKTNVIRYITEAEIKKNEKIFNSYKIFISKSAGNPQNDFKIIGFPYIGEPRTACTDSLITIGAFDNEIEVKNLQKYLFTKFVRYMISILKVSQNVSQNVYQYVPLQDFTPASDIDWNASVAEIDRQLYAKYGLSEEEMEFIESKVRAM